MVVVAGGGGNVAGFSPENENQIHTALGSPRWGPEEWGRDRWGVSRIAGAGKLPCPPVKFKAHPPGLLPTLIVPAAPPVSLKGTEFETFECTSPCKSSWPQPVAPCVCPSFASFFLCHLSPPLLSTRFIYLFMRISLI